VEKFNHAGQLEFEFRIAWAPLGRTTCGKILVTFRISALTWA